MTLDVVLMKDRPFETIRAEDERRPMSPAEAIWAELHRFEVMCGVGGIKDFPTVHVCMAWKLLGIVASPRRSRE